MIHTFASDFAKKGMLAYVEKIQRQERENGVDALQHQKWSGANYYDSVIKTVQGGISSTAAMGKGITHHFPFLLSSICFDSSTLIFILPLGTYFSAGVTEEQFKEAPSKRVLQMAKGSVGVIVRSKI